MYRIVVAMVRVEAQARVFSCRERVWRLRSKRREVEAENERSCPAQVGKTGSQNEVTILLRVAMTVLSKAYTHSRGHDIILMSMRSG